MKITIICIVIFIIILLLALPKVHNDKTAAIMDIYQISENEIEQPVNLWAAPKENSR